MKDKYIYICGVLMIPKIVHYCWLSNNPIPQELQKYIASWKQVLPDFEFILWNFDRFQKGQSKWVAEAFEKKKYAFASDYIRLYALYNYGGIYLDMDVEVLKPYGDMLNLPTIIGFENSKAKGLEVAAFGVEKHSSWVKMCLDHYDQRTFINSDGSFNDQPLPGVIKHLLVENGYRLIPVSSLAEAKNVSEKSIPVFPMEFFSPKNHVSGKIKKTELSYTIHHFAGSWEPLWQRLERKFWHLLGLRDMRIILRMKNLFKYGSIKSVPEKSRLSKKI